MNIQPGSLSSEGRAKRYDLGHIEQEGHAPRFGRLVRALVLVATGVSGLVLGPTASKAVPSFARQTGMTCSVCHTSIPELTSFGRQFKMNGYVLSMPPDPKMALPITAFMVGGFTHTQKAQDAPPLQSSQKTNDILSLDQFSLFYAGKIADNLGAFAQFTYSPDAKSWSWDNTDIRWAKSGSLFGKDATFGLSLNNNPTVQDLWATTPAWGYPQFGSAVAPQFGPPGTMLQGTLAQTVVGLTGYSMFSNGFYTEFGGYTGLSPAMLTHLGTGDPGFQVKGFAPYLRLAYSESLSKKSTLMVGLMAMAADLKPTAAGSSGSDRYVDLGFDTQYDYSGHGYGLTLKARDIIEWQHTSGVSPFSGASNSANHLNATDISLTYYRSKWAVIGAFSRVSGSSDAGLYGTNSAIGSPNSKSVSLEVNYSPWMDGGPSWDPRGNLKFGVQYIHYLQLYGGTTNFDGAGHNASDNNTLFVYAMLAF
jgi:hypothetical protein